MKIGYTGWTWFLNEYTDPSTFGTFYKKYFEQFCLEASNLGYETIENFSFLADYYKDEADVLKEQFERYGLKFENLYFYFSNDFDADVEKAKGYIEFMKKIGAHYMNMQGFMWKDTPFIRPTDRDGVMEYARLANTIGKMCAEAGIKACMHPHMNTLVFKEDQIDLFMENTDPQYVYLCMDTAHTTLAGMHAPTFAKKWGKRMGYVHLKDIDPNENAHPEWPMKRFLPLGYGCVDFKGVVEALKEEGYDGILCVELDYQPVCNYKSAMDSRNYIRNVLGM